MKQVQRRVRIEGRYFWLSEQYDGVQRQGWVYRTEDDMRADKDPIGSYSKGKWTRRVYGTAYPSPAPGTRIEYSIEVGQTLSSGWGDRSYLGLSPAQAYRAMQEWIVRRTTPDA